MLLPRPGSIVGRPGSFVLDADTRVIGPAPLVELLRGELRATALPLAGEGAGRSIELGLDPRLGDEAYRLDVDREGIRLRGGTRAGVFYGLQTLRQLLPASVWRRAAPAGTPWEVPGCCIEDEPAFAWRGGMLDVARHFMPKDFLFRWVDLLALHKLNVFHLHLTDDQGWRFQSLRYPKLAEFGSWRAETLGDGTPHGGFYTQEDLREVVAYAGERSITVVPEVEMPGHMRAAVAAYPDLGNLPQRRLQVGTRWGVEETVLDLHEGALRFAEEILDEVLDVFPSRYIHLGGDECPTVEWAANDRLRAQMKDRGVREVGEFQRWFAARMQGHLADRGRVLIGWDEIVDAGPVPGAVVMGWRSAEHGRRAAELGQEVVMAAHEATYFDYPQGSDPGEPGAGQLGRIDLAQAYAFDPLGGIADQAVASRVLGTQFQLWTERIPTPRGAEYQAFPRACALAEVAWSGAGGDDDEFRRRLGGFHLPRLEALGVNFRPLTGPHPWQRVQLD